MRLLIAVVISLITSWNFGQIPNGGFEEWETRDSLEQPLIWQTYFGMEAICATKDTHKTEGQYALKIITLINNSGWEAPCSCPLSYATKLDHKTRNNQSLYFDLKSIPTVSNSNSTFLMVFVELFNDSISNFFKHWENHDVIPDFQTIEIPFEGEGYDSIKLSIFGGAALGQADGCFSLSNTWLDNFRIDSSSTLSVLNPYFSHNQFQIVLDINKIQILGNTNSIARTQVFDIYGRLLNQGKEGQYQISVNQSGILIVLVHTKTRKKELFKVFNYH